MSAEANAMSVEVDTQATDDQLRQKIESMNEPAATKEPAADGNHAAAEPAAAPAAEPAAPAAGEEKKEEAPAPKPDEEKKEEEKKCKEKCKEKKEKKKSDKPDDATKLGCAGGLRKLFAFGGKKGKKAKPLDPPAVKVCRALSPRALPCPALPLYPLPCCAARRHLVSSRPSAIL